MSKKQPLKVIAGAPDRPLVIGDIEIPCYVLQGETRVLSQRGLQYGVGLPVGGGQRGAPKIVDFLNSMQKKDIEINDLNARLMEPIEFQPPQGRTAYGYPATILADICDVALDAQRTARLSASQQRIVDRCRILHKGFSRVGIIALVDEATGYQEIRDRKALQEILDKYLLAHEAKWAKRFPDEFYQEIFRLRSWQWPGIQVNRPWIVGKFTKNIVWQRLAPGVAEELEQLNPKNEAGHRRSRHHQYLTPDIGHSALQRHLIGVMAIMRASINWEQFQRSLQRAYPKINVNIELPLSDLDEE